MCEPEGFNLRDLAAAARAFRTYDEFGKSMEKVRRLSLAETADCLTPMFRLLADAGVHGDAAVLRVTVAWWQARGLPDD